MPNIIRETVGLYESKNVDSVTENKKKTMGSKPKRAANYLQFD